jgi:hypothetical protein
MSQIRRFISTVDAYTLWAFNTQAPLGHRGYRG